jgi:hypothetical protein
MLAQTTGQSLLNYQYIFAKYTYQYIFRSYNVGTEHGYGRDNSCQTSQIFIVGRFVFFSFNVVFFWRRQR